MKDMDSNSSSSWWKEIERMPPYTFQDSYQEGFVFKMVRMHICGRSSVLQGFIEKSWSRLPRFPILHWNTGFELEASKYYIQASDTETIVSGFLRPTLCNSAAQLRYLHVV